MTTPFWTSDPSILLNKDQINELFPMPNMSYEQKINSVARLVILITLIAFLFKKNIIILIYGFLTLFGIYLVIFYRKKNTASLLNNEGFEVQGSEIIGLQEPSPINKIENQKSLGSVLKQEFKMGNKKNPFSNVLLTQINDEPNRAAAPPAFNPEVDVDITNNVKKSVQFLNPEIKNTNKQIFGDLWENFKLDNSNRVFFTTPNTRVANDQSAYAMYLYGNMPSGKGSTMEDNMQRLKDNYRYTLY